jgi:hypothetical protein
VAATAIGANRPHLIQPGVNFGQGFGNLPSDLAFLRPFAITGALSLEVPTARRSTNQALDPYNRVFNQDQTRNYAIVHWSLALEFSTYYLTDRFTGGPPKAEPVNQFVPLVEFSADTDEAGHAFQFEAGHLYRSEAGHRSDLMSATGGLLPRIEVDDVSGDRIGQARIDFKSTNVAFAGFRR